MIKSMTGYGKSSASSDCYDIEVEIKSVNHRFLDLNFRMPSVFNETEMKLRERAKDLVSRGSLTIYVGITEKPGKEKIKKINFETAESYKRQLEELRDYLGFDQKIDMEMIMKFQDIYDHRVILDEIDTHDKIMECFNDAAKELVAYREREGENIFRDIDLRINDLEFLVHQIGDLAKDCSKIQFEKLLARINNFSSSETFSKERLEQELVMISDRVDISEEISRLKSHIELFRETMNENRAVGKVINNITQEMHREASTISAKTNLTEISHISVKMKEIIEMIREQVQNVE